MTPTAWRFLIQVAIVAVALIILIWGIPVLVGALR